MNGPSNFGEGLWEGAKARVSNNIIFLLLAVLGGPGSALMADWD